MRAPLQHELVRTIEELAAFGEKRAGTNAGARAAEYLFDRMRKAGLEDVHEQPFAFPRHDLLRASFGLTVAGAARPMAFAALEASGSGSVDGEVVHVGWATREQLAGVALAGGIALVDRNPLYHRSTQYYDVAAAGAAALLFASTAPSNLPQVGSVRRAWEAVGPIPALTIGGVDAHALRAAIDAGESVRARIAVEAEVSRAVGRNVVGRVRGLGEGELVVGAHFDSWFAGSSDNGGGVAAMLALAERRARRAPARYGVTFVAWDGEELALYGGYHLLRRYALDRTRPLAVIDFETPSAIGAQAYGLARSNHAPLEEAIVGVGLHELFALNVPMDLVAELFGGVIPTDIQGLYRAGTPAVATAVDAPYYHTVEDTPDKVDLGRLEETVVAFDHALDRLMTAAPERFFVRDPALWRAEVALDRLDGDLIVDVHVYDAGGRAQAGAFVEAVLFEDDFFACATVRGHSGGDGAVALRFVGAAEGKASRFVHVAAGVRWPLVERVCPL
jgi:peptidase M28-like protein